MVDQRRWIDAREFEDANAAAGLLPGPASTQLAIFCAYRVAGRAGAVVGGLAFILPAVVLVLLLSTLFLADAPPEWVRGAGMGAAGAVPAVAVQAASSLAPASWQHARTHHDRWLIYLLAGAIAAASVGPYVVLVLLGCGAIELSWERRTLTLLAPIPLAASAGGVGALAWVALKVGALSYGGGFVIIPLMQADAVHVYHWMTNEQFLNAVALGQATPGPVTATVAAVGYAAHGVAGGLFAALVAFAPSFAFVLVGGSRFEQLRANRSARAFLNGAGPAAIGAIFGAAIALARALSEPWQFAVLAAAAIALLVVRRGVVETLLAAGAIGVAVALLG